MCLGGSKVQYWFLRADPLVYSWKEMWLLKRMTLSCPRSTRSLPYFLEIQPDDLCFFFLARSMKYIVGVVRVVKEAYPDPVDVTKVQKKLDIAVAYQLVRPVYFKRMIQHPFLADKPFLTVLRAPLMPVDPKSWEIISGMGGID